LSDTPLEAAKQDPPQSGSGTAAPSTTTTPAAQTIHEAEVSWWGSVWTRIKEHKIAQWTIAYAAFAFVALHVATLASDALEWPHAVVRTVILVLILGFPIVPILAWYHGVRALKRVSGSELIIIALLLVIGGSLLWLLPRPNAERAGTETPSPLATINPKPETTEAAFNPPAHSIAVLPFVNMSGDPKEDYFSDGISEELLNALSRLNDLQVVARTSSFSFKGKDVDVSTIAHKLNVGAVLEGSVRRAGNTVRITAQLINTVTGFHLWSETYDRPLNDIFKVQTEVATAVAQQLEIKLAGNESAKLDVGGTKNPEAYDAYLRAQRVRQENEGGAMNRTVVEAVDKAIALDPEYAAAYALRAPALATLSYEPKLEGAKALREQAIASAERAVALAPDLGDAHVALGYVRSLLLQDFNGAGVEFDRALALAPGSADVQRYAAGYLADMVHFEPAFVATQRALILDPQDYRSYFQQAVILYYARRYGEAIAAMRHAQALQPRSTDVGRQLIEFLFVSGQVEQARQLLETPTSTIDEHGVVEIQSAVYHILRIAERDRVQILSMVYHTLGRQADAQNELDEYKKIVGDDRPYRIATVYAQWGNAPAALRWLDRAVQAHDIYLSHLKVDPLLDPIRSEPQFKALVARMKFPP
jgi:TolB-like protein/Flp pilus assembly protein TadD